MQMIELETHLECLAMLCKETLYHKVLHCLTAKREPLSSLVIARALGVQEWGVQRALNVLVTEGRVARYTGDDGLMYRAVEIGTCEWCGLISHALVAAECPSCRTRVAQQERAVARGPSYE